MNFYDYDFQYIDGVDEIVADSAIEPSYALVTIMASLLVSAASVLFSWNNFRRADMKWGEDDEKYNKIRISEIKKR